MRKIINSTFITLDGIIANPHLWPSGRVSDDAGLAIQTDLLFSCDAMIFGRHTYDSFSGAWPARSGDPFADRMNSLDKYVVSSTLREATWKNTTIVSRDPIEYLAQLKKQPGQNIVQYGFGQLSYALMHHGLLDELRLWVHPFFLGTYGPDGLLYRPGPTTQFELIDSRALKNGDVLLTYGKR